MLKNVLFALLMLLPATFACANEPQLLPAKADAIDSVLLKQKRPIEVYLPVESAKDPTQRYETLYVLDGDWNAKIVVDVVTFMRSVGFMPPVIVVSVPNVFDAKGVNSRDHDLTPTVMAGQPRSGGAREFLAFLKTELVPYVNAHYPASGVNLVHGHSFGGTFLMYVLAHEPALFDGYAILDPAMWWDNHSLDPVLAATLPMLPAQGKAIFVGARAGQMYEEMGMAKVEPIFKAKAPAALHWTVTQYPGESHDSLKLKGTYDALKYAYQGYPVRQMELIPSAGIVLKDKPVYLGLNGDGDSADAHYTTDGTAPTAASPKFAPQVAITDPTKTTIALLSNRGIYDRVLVHSLKSGDVLEPPAHAVGADRKWRLAFYAAEAWPELARARPFKTGTAEKEIDFDGGGRDAFAGIAGRNLAIPAEGYYVIGVGTSGQVRVSLAGTTLFEHDGAHGQRQHAFVVPLRRGVYPLRVEFRPAAKTPDLDVVVFQCKDGEPEWWKNQLILLSSKSRP